MRPSTAALVVLAAYILAGCTLPDACDLRDWRNRLGTACAMERDAAIRRCQDYGWGCP